MSRVLRFGAVGLALVVTAVGGTVAITDAWGQSPAAAPTIAPAAAGDPTPTASFVPLTPCRVADTRASGAGPIAAGGVRTVAVVGTSFRSQGGSSTTCGVPTQASAVAITLTAVSASRQGALEVWAAGTTDPRLTTLQYAPANPLSGGFTVPVSSTGLSVKSTSATVHALVDVTGYYVPIPSAQVGKDGTVTSNSGFSGGPGDHNTGVYFVFSSRSLLRCAINVTPGLGLISAQADTSDGLSIVVRTYQVDDETGKLALADGNFTISAIC